MPDDSKAAAAENQKNTLAERALRIYVLFLQFSLTLYTWTQARQHIVRTI